MDPVLRRDTLKVVEHELTAPWESVLMEPATGSSTGVVVLAGSSGRVGS
ncbi:hypothetical protein ABZY44_24815 [Streptomyces sp. NPDC006544]